MSRTVILDTDYATLWYYPETKIVHHVFHKFIHGPHLREVLEKGLELVQEHEAQKWLSDDRKNTALAADDNQWGLSDWGPRMLAAGWKHWAIVLPESAVGQGIMNRSIAAFAERGLTVHVFQNADDALAWLVEA